MKFELYFEYWLGIASVKIGGNGPHILDFCTSSYSQCTLLSRNIFQIPIKEEAKRALEQFSKG